MRQNASVLEWRLRDYASIAKLWKCVTATERVKTEYGSHFMVWLKIYTFCTHTICLKFWSICFRSSRKYFSVLYNFRILILLNKSSLLKYKYFQIIFSSIFRWKTLVSYTCSKIQKQQVSFFRGILARNRNYISISDYYFFFMNWTALDYRHIWGAISQNSI